MRHTESLIFLFNLPTWGVRSNQTTETRLAAVETLFLDAGNTLISMDYSWVLEELATAGIVVGVEEFKRAEAAARPGISAQMVGVSGQSSAQAFTSYLERAVLPLALQLEQREADIRRRVSVAVERLKQPGQDHRLWSWVMPGVEAALATLHSRGYRLVVVSNSDGSVERALQAAGLTQYLADVCDSTLVGFEKPDPRFFEHALRVSGANRETTLHVGDMYFQDIRGAQAAGIEAVLLDPYDDWDVDDCIRCRSLIDLADRLIAARR